MSHSTASNPQKLDNVGFVKLWRSLYDPAMALAADTCDENDLSTHRQRIVNMLDAMTKVIFGLDETKKAIATVYGEGLLELTMKLMESAQVLYPPQQDTVDLVWFDAACKSGVKMVKCCVILNKVGRKQCRSAGIFDFLQAVLSTFLDRKDPEAAAFMVEETLTTLAAICLGDDLNALQGAVQLRHSVDRASVKYSKSTHPGMHQKITYLSTLFDLTIKEERSLVAEGSEDLFQRVRQAELLLRSGLERERAGNYLEALLQYTNALNEIEIAKGDSTTRLLDSFMCQVYEKRASVQLRLDLWEEALQDVTAVLSFSVPEATVRAERMRATALEGMGKVEEAKEALGKAVVANPQDEALRAHLERLTVE